MEKVRYNKLIRDKVVDRMRRLNVAFEVRSPKNNAEFTKKLLAKVLEEASGIPPAARKSKRELMEEIADLERVIMEVKRHFNIDEREMALIRAKNFFEKGGFDERVILVWSQKEGYTSNEKA